MGYSLKINYKKIESDPKKSTPESREKRNQQFNWHGDFIIQLPKEVDKKYYLSRKVTDYVPSSGTKNFYSKPATDLKIARPLLATMHKMHRAGVDNYITKGTKI